MPVETEILGNKKKTTQHRPCPTQATISASKDSASVQALLLGAAQEPVPGELAGLPKRLFAALPLPRPGLH